MSKYYSENIRTKDGQIVLIGDSMIEYYEQDEHLDYTDIDVYNRGIAGETSGEMLSRFQDDALLMAPHILIIDIGSNDIGKGVPQDIILGNIERAIVLAKNHEIEHILISSITPLNTAMRGDYGKFNKEIVHFNTRLRELAESNNVVYLDFYSKVVDANGELDAKLTYDGAHLNADGYDIFTSVLLPHIRQFLNDKH